MGGGNTHQLLGRTLQIRKASPTSPQQNGIIERLNRTLIEKMRCLLLWSKLPKSFWDVALLHANWLRNRTPTSALKGGIPLVAWSNKQINFNKIHTFGCLVQYLKVGHDKDNKGEKYATRTAYGIFLGMPKNQAGFLIWDPTRTDMLVRDDVKFYDEVPGYPRLQLDKKNPEVPRDNEYFSLFPMEGEEAARAFATPIPTRAPANSPPSLLLATTPPIDVIQLSSDTESGVHEADEEEGEVQGVLGESIADRVAARRRAHFASFGDVL